MKITIGGGVSTGKDETSDRLAKRLGFPKPVSAGDIIRQCATEAGFSDVESFVRTLGGVTCDRVADERTRLYGQQNDNFIYQGRLPWYFIPDSVKILLACDPEVRAARYRIREEKRQRILTFNDALRLLVERDHQDRERYRKLYNIDDFAHRDHYDLVVDTDKRNPDEVVEVILGFLGQHRVALEV